MSVLEALAWVVGIFFGSLTICFVAAALTKANRTLNQILNKEIEKDSDDSQDNSQER